MQISEYFKGNEESEDLLAYFTNCTIKHYSHVELAKYTTEASSLRTNLSF